MRKEYIRPITDVVASQLNNNLLDHSYGWADAKGNPDAWDDENQSNVDDLKNRNLWDD